MFVLLDSKDLIDLIDHGKPCDTTKVAEIFRERGWQFVFSTANVIEYAASVLHTDDQLAIRRGLQQIESLPSIYIRHGWIEQHEAEAGYTAFQQGREPRRINPFVQRWDETLVSSGRPKATASYVNFRLDEMVLGLRDRLDLRRFAGFAEQAILDDRAGRDLVKVPDAERYARTQEWRMRTLKYGPDDPSERRELADWFARTPMRCPGTWFYYRLREELIRNVQDRPKCGDLPDLSHASSVPYVNAVTFDRRMLGYARAAAKKIDDMLPEGALAKRLFKSLEEILASG